MDNQGVGKWIKHCIKCVAQWSNELDAEIKDSGDTDSGANNKVVEEHKQVWLELMDRHDIFMSAGGSVLHLWIAQDDFLVASRVQVDCRQ